jgi:hypothetical protein
MPDTLAYPIVAVILLAGAWRALQLWRNAETHLHAFPDALVRTFPALTATMALFLGGAGVLLILDELGFGGTDQLGLLYAIVVVAAIALTIRVALRGEPAWLVPPHLREKVERRRR